MIIVVAVSRRSSLQCEKCDMQAGERMISTPNLAMRRAALAAIIVLALLIVVGAGLLGYRLLDRSGAFAVERMQIVGGNQSLTPSVRTETLQAIGSASLLTVDTATLQAALEGIPGVRTAAIDRAFPSTLRIQIVSERAVAVAPTGKGLMVIAATGRVVGQAGKGSASLPVIAAAPSDIPGLGGVITAPAVVKEVRLAAAQSRGFRFVAIGYGDDGMVARTAQGIAVKFGDPTDLAAKFAVARSIFRRTQGQNVVYINVTVPTAPVLRLELPDQITANAPATTLAALPPVGDLGVWVAGSAPAESIQSLFS